MNGVLAWFFVFGYNLFAVVDGLFKFVGWVILSVKTQRLCGVLNGVLKQTEAEQVIAKQFSISKNPVAVGAPDHGQVLAI